MSDRRAKVVVFDLGEVLVKLDFSKIMALRSISHSGVQHSIQSMNEWPLYDAFERGRVTESQFVARLNQEFSQTFTVEQFRQLWNSVLTDTMPGVEGLLEELSRRYPLYALTNSNETHIQHLKENYSWVNCFTKVLTSHELGYRKPEAQIYEKLITIAKCPPNQILFLDDRLENVLGAKALGIHAELVTEPSLDLPRILADLIK
jgi:putative hydrolase of the HAD superfamily